MHGLKRCCAIVMLVLSLAACSTAGRLSNIGKAPDLTPIKDVAAPEAQGSLGRPTLSANRAANAERLAAAAPKPSTSLYRTGAQAFFKDQRATAVGDILTVLINVQDQAQVGNTTSRTRSATESAGLDNFLGFESELDSFLPGAVAPGDLVNIDSGSTSTGTGTVQRSETIDLTVAAIVTHVLPNGNMIIQGRQEVRVNFEVRELLVAGVVRPQDVTTINTIDHDQIAEARISYGGRGQISDIQQARYGQQLYEILFPF